MAPVLTAITDTVHFVAHRPGQLDTGHRRQRRHADRRRLSRQPRGRARLVAAARLRRRRPPRDPVDPRPHRPFRVGHLVRENPWHTGVLPRRRGRALQAGVPRAGVARRHRHAHLAATLAEWSVAISRKGGDDARRHPDHAGAHRGRRGGAAGQADGHSHARPHRRALLVRGRRCARRRRRVGDRPPGVDTSAARSCCRTCSTTTRTGACGAWPRWGCWTPRCCCPATGRCGGARSATPARKPQRRRPRN